VAQRTHAADGDKVAVDLAHELRTSLAIVTLISGNLDLLYAHLSEQERKQMIQDIRRHTQRLNDLIGRVLQLCNAKSTLPL
jgi:signal transduction histidine kinase